VATFAFSHGPLPPVYRPSIVEASGPKFNMRLRLRRCVYYCYLQHPFSDFARFPATFAPMFGKFLVPFHANLTALTGGLRRGLIYRGSCFCSIGPGHFFDRKWTQPGLFPLLEPPKIFFFLGLTVVKFHLSFPSFFWDPPLHIPVATFVPFSGGDSIHASFSDHE